MTGLEEEGRLEASAEPEVEPRDVGEEEDAADVVGEAGPVRGCIDVLSGPPEQRPHESLRFKML
jgi:hypothetical protein